MLEALARSQFVEHALLSSSGSIPSNISTSVKFLKGAWAGNTKYFV